MTKVTELDDGSFAVKVHAAEAALKPVIAEFGMLIFARAATTQYNRFMQDKCIKHKSNKLDRLAIDAALTSFQGVAVFDKFCREVEKLEPHEGAGDNVVTFPATDRTPLAAAS